MYKSCVFYFLWTTECILSIADLLFVVAV